MDDERIDRVRMDAIEDLLVRVQELADDNRRLRAACDRLAAEVRRLAPLAAPVWPDGDVAGGEGGGNG